MIGLDAGVLVVEYAHWADDAALEFQLFLAADPARSASLVVTCRTEDVPAASLLRRLTSRRPAQSASLRLMLGPLNVNETAELVSSMLAGR